MRYEVKIGILAITAIALSFWGYKFIEGTNLLSSSNAYYALYDDVGGLTVGTPITISGVTVGAVNGILLDQMTKRVSVTFDIKDGINIPKGTEAYITSVSMLGEKAVILEYAVPCAGTGDCLPEGSQIEGYTRGILASFIGGGGKGEEGDGPLDGIKDQLASTLDSLNYTLFDPNSDNPIARSTNDLAVTMENLKYATARLQGIMNQNAGEINATFDNLETLTNTLAAKQESIAGIIDNAEAFTGDLSKIELEKTMAEVNEAIVSLKTTLQKADQAVAGVTQVFTKVNNGEGTLGKLLTDDAIYDRLNSATMKADTLFSDFQERPYRYIPFKSRKKVLKNDRKDAELEDNKQN
jgi:phospholipid/cholesterol/gamma-HCH transport system substrate-binding protein